jgi:hypothetical protein
VACFKYYFNVNSEVFTVAKIDKIFSGSKSCQLAKNYPNISDNLSPLHQILMIMMKATEMLPETSVIFNQLTLLTILLNVWRD